MVRDCAIIIWRGGSSKISKVGFKIKLQPPELKLKITSCPPPSRGEITFNPPPPLPQPPILPYIPLYLYTNARKKVCLFGNELLLKFYDSFKARAGGNIPEMKKIFHCRTR